MRRPFAVDAPLAQLIGFRFRPFMPETLAPSSVLLGWRHLATPQSDFWRGFAKIAPKPYICWPRIGEKPLFALADLLISTDLERTHIRLKMRYLRMCPFESGQGRQPSNTSQNSPSTGAWIGLEWGEMLRTGIAPETCEMTAERLSCWPPESRTGFGHRISISTKIAVGRHTLSTQRAIAISEFDCPRQVELPRRRDQLEAMFTRRHYSSKPVDSGLNFNCRALSRMTLISLSLNRPETWLRCPKSISP